MLKNIKKYHNKNVIVIGLARSGVGAANLLCELGVHVQIRDSKPASELTDFIKKLNPSVTVETGAHYKVPLLKETALVVISPGVPLHNSLVQEARFRGIEVIGELELAFSIADAPFIAITGTNGKTTTTALTNHLLKQAGLKTLLCGNIGNSVCDELVKNSLAQGMDFIVAEVSSFQLETIKDFHPHIAAILNITPDHLDRHGSMKDYIDAKARIFLNQKPEDYLILNGKAPEVSSLAQRASARTLFFGNRNSGFGTYLENKWITYAFPQHSGKLLPVSEIPLSGEHNWENIMASSAIALAVGLSKDIIRESIKSFKGLPHRLELVDTLRGISFYNDSKATNIDAVVRALENFTSVILLMGGKDKAGDFSVLKHLIKERVKLLVLFGESRSKIAHVLGSETRTIRVDNFRDAVVTAYNNAISGDIVLLCPGCASFDMFRDYNERGERFRKIVSDIADKDLSFTNRDEETI
jgi:UDP-N-acetylmuramoylalanine--D-glutamate ligase